MVVLVQMQGSGVQWRRSAAATGAGRTSNSEAGPRLEELEALRRDAAAAREELLLLGILETSVLCRSCSRQRQGAALSLLCPLDPRVKGINILLMVRCLCPQLLLADLGHSW